MLGALQKRKHFKIVIWFNLPRILARKSQNLGLYSLPYDETTKFKKIVVNGVEIPNSYIPLIPHYISQKIKCKRRDCGK